MAEILLAENAVSPNTPAAGQMAFYAKTDNNLYAKTPAGVEILVTAGSGITALTGQGTATGPGSAVFTLSNNTVLNSQLALETAYTVMGNNTGSPANPAYIDVIKLNTPGYTDTGIILQLTENVSAYAQSILQNLSANTAASTDYVVSNDQGTSSTHYGDFGINSSTFTGSGSLSIAGGTYLLAQNSDLAIGTGTSNAIHLVANDSSTDALTINTSNQVVIPALTGYVYANGSSALTASTTVPGSAISGNISGDAANVTGTVAIANGGTGQTTATNAINALLPAQGSFAGYFLTTNGTVASWASLSPGISVLPNNFTVTGTTATWNTFSTSNTFQPIQAMQAPTLINGTSNVGSGYALAGYWMDQYGYVHLQGFVENGASGTTVMFTLGSPYLPIDGKIHIFSIVTQVSSTVFTFGWVIVDGSTGNVSMQTPYNNQTVPLDSIMWRAGQ